LQNHENIKNCTYLLPAAMPGNNSEPKTWANIRLKSSNSRLWYQHAKNTGICFVRKSSYIRMNWKHLRAKIKNFVGQVETQKGSEVCSSDFNNACRVFGADLSIEICSNSFVGEKD
jgi:hypothetical protein